MLLLLLLDGLLKSLQPALLVLQLGLIPPLLLPGPAVLDLLLQLQPLYLGVQVVLYVVEDPLPLLLYLFFLFALDHALQGHVRVLVLGHYEHGHGRLLVAEQL
jgi:hypothetical protein